MEKRKNIIKKILITLGILCSVILTFTVIYERPTFADSGHSVSHSSSHSSHSSSHSSSSAEEVQVAVLGHHQAEAVQVVEIHL